MPIQSFRFTELSSGTPNVLVAKEMGVRLLQHVDVLRRLHDLVTVRSSNQADLRLRAASTFSA